jgi:hypothetical protein
MSDGGKKGDILLVEDNPNDVELILHVFQWCNLIDRIHVTWDGAEALDYIFGRGAYKGRASTEKPKLILLDFSGVHPFYVPSIATLCRQFSNILHRHGSSSYKRSARGAGWQYQHGSVPGSR